MSEWTRPAQPVRCVVDLSAPLTVRRERGVLVQGDDNANAIVVEVYQAKDVPYDLSGSTVTLTFVRPDKLAAPPISAEITGNVAVMTLTDICYRVSGLYAASVKLQKGNAERTIVRLLGDIISTENNGTVTEEHILPTPEELLAMLKQIEQARDNANSAANSAKEAAERATDAASAIENVTASAQTLATGQDATVSVTNITNGKLFSFGLPRGDKGETGKSGVHVGSTAPADPSVNVWIDPDGTVDPDSPVDAGTLGGKPPEYYLAPRDLLDNSNYADPVNQRGNNHEVINGTYFIDRWILSSADNNGVYYDVNSDMQAIGFSCASGSEFYLTQKLPDGLIDPAKSYTVAYKTSDGNLVAYPYTYETYDGYYAYQLSFRNTVYLRWVALYEGTYTPETLPPYVPKGYAVELVECLRYYANAGRFYSRAYNKYTLYNSSMQAPLPMRKTPSVVVSSPSTNADNAIYQSGFGDITNFIVTPDSKRSATIGSPTGGFVANEEYTWYAIFSAEL